MSFVRGLTCKECGTAYPVTPRMICDECFGPVEVSYDYAAMRGVVTRERIESGPRSLWRYRDLLPIEGEPRAGLRSGYTPLVRAERLGRELGVRELYLKDDSANYPTFSYKDRVVAVAVTRAIEFGFDTVGCASTGNLAHAVAAHAAAAGLSAVIFIPHDLEAGKVVATLVFGPRLVKVRGNYDDVNRLCTEIADEYGWAIVNVNLRPYYTEGAKTHGFEIAEQLGWRLPKHTVVPVAGGTILPKVWKAYREFIDLGLVADDGPRIHAAQAKGCNPVARAIESGADTFQPQKPNTIAKSIAIGNPADGPYAIRVVRDSGGFAASASDGEILDAVERLARSEGIFTEPAGGTTLACAIQLIESGRIPRDEPVCVSITGNGLKTIEAQQGRLPEVPVIEARLEAFAAIAAPPKTAAPAGSG
ncbi:MAG TPA: threonine synthase [Vicinamibacteria bacterium]|nr:threonine synthase [Vicinamibacteria bacterium]